MTSGPMKFRREVGYPTPDGEDNPHGRSFGCIARRARARYRRLDTGAAKKIVASPSATTGARAIGLENKRVRYGALGPCLDPMRRVLRLVMPVAGHQCVTCLQLRVAARQINLRDADDTAAEEALELHFA